MPRPKVWGDFEEDEGFAAKDDAGDDLVEFTCPWLPVFHAQGHPTADLGSHSHQSWAPLED